MTSETNKFIAKLNYLGGRLATSQRISFKTQYVDLEEFFLQSTNYANTDSRLCRSLEHWIRKFGILLSPSKTRRILKKEKHRPKYDPVILGVWIDTIMDNKRNQNNWTILEPYASTSKRTKTLFNNTPTPRKPDPIFAGRRIQAPFFTEEWNKYLRNIDHILKNCPELNSRLIHRNQVASDLIAIKQKHPKMSLYRISKIIHSDISRVVKEYNFLKYFELAA